MALDFYFHFLVSRKSFCFIYRYHLNYQNDKDKRENKFIFICLPIVLLDIIYDCTHYYCCCFKANIQTNGKGGGDGGQYVWK